MGAGKAEWFKDHKHGPEMVVVPGGEFMMGSPESELGRWDNEGPLHGVKFGRPFCVGRHVVRRGQFATFVSETTYKVEGGAQVWTGTEWKPDPICHGAIPVSARTTVILWCALIGTMHALISRGYPRSQGRLIVCSPRLSGSTLPAPERRRRSGGAPRSRRRTPTTTAIRAEGSKANGESQPCPLATSRQTRGAFTMCNVWEWCEDIWHDNYNGAPADGSAWLHGGDASRRVIRGGSWYFFREFLRSAYRNRCSPDTRNHYLGFRVGRVLLS
jgi:formylglycine-generating enzyme required for sulfatase activity